MNESIIEVRDLVKRDGKVAVVAGVNFDVPHTRLDKWQMSPK